MKGAAVATIVGGRVVYLHPMFSRIIEGKHNHLSSHAQG
jgi:hypothetical protein